MSIVITSPDGYKTYTITESSPDFYTLTIRRYHENGFITPLGEPQTFKNLTKDALKDMLARDYKAAQNQKAREAQLELELRACMGYV